MANEPPDYCAYCGSERSPVEPPTTHYCGVCREYVFFNPVPTARLAILDGEKILLGRVDVPDRRRAVTPVKSYSSPLTRGVAVDRGERPSGKERSRVV